MTEPRNAGDLSVFTTVLQRDLRIAMRQKSDVLMSLVFFVIVASLFPLAIGPETALLQRIAPGILWVGALLAAVLSLQRMFASDHADGSLEQMLLSPTPLYVTVVAKTLGHWLLAGLPLVLVGPVLGLQFNLDGRGLMLLTASLLLGTPVLSLVGSVGAALTLGVRGGGVLLALLILPLYVPVLIFGAGAVEADAAGLDASGHLLLLGAMFVLGAFFAPWATTAALRISLE
ncbi:heme exporter protein CcmB [Rhizobacter sp. LjRoot28]|jgi:heme exporter protein B|uniref:heme exporter protein CcmB n=1 Tax=Rhizobacter sp. LjRoot28 TaxID=3342309 RepID=UPI003ECE103E